MKKYINAIIVAFFLLAVCGKSYALTNWGESDLYKQLKSAFNTTDGTGSSVGGMNATGTIKTAGNVQFQGSLFAAGNRGSASTVLFSSSTTFQLANIPYTYILKAIGNNPTTETSLLPAALPNQEVVLSIYAAGPAGSWTVKPDTAATTPVNSTDFTSIKFSAVGQKATLLYLNDTLGWVIKSYAGSPTIVAPSLN